MRGENRADGDVVDRCDRSDFELLCVVSRKAKTGRGADDTSRFDGWEIVLADMQAEPEKSCIVGTVIEDEIWLAFGASFENDKKIPVEVRFVPNLNPVCSTVD